MNIGIVNPGFDMGGAERICIELANSLSAKNQISLIDFSGNNVYFYKTAPEIKKVLTIPQLTSKRITIRKLLSLKYKITKRDMNPVTMYKEQAVALLKVLEKARFDLIIMSQGLVTALIPYIKSKLPDLKIIAWQHNNYDVYVNNYNRNILKYYKQGLKQADLVVCLTENDAEKFRKINPASIYIYNILTIEEPLISDVKNKHILFVGRLAMEQKGLDFILDLAKRLEDGWDILVAGDGVDREKFKNMIFSAALEDKIILAGNLNSSELKEFYSKGSIFISTSRWEGFGLSITEAMASGLPVIGFDNLGPAEILANGKYGILIKKFDIDHFSAQLGLLMKDYKLRKSWSQKSLERAEDFKEESIINQWEKQIDKMMKKAEE